MLEADVCVVMSVRVPVDCPAASRPGGTPSLPGPPSAPSAPPARPAARPGGYDRFRYQGRTTVSKRRRAEPMAMCMSRYW